MKDIGGKTKLIFLASIFVTGIMLYRFQSIRLSHSFLSTMNMRNDDRIGTLQLQEAIPKPSYVVYYLWCTEKIFEFRNYLSVTSVINHLEPEKIVLFYKYYPGVDSTIYNVWLDEIIQKYLFFETLKVSDTVCGANDSSKQDFVRTYFESFEGIPWEEHAMLTSKPTNTDTLYIIANGTKFFADCSSASSMDNETSLPLCIILDRSLYPKDIWKLDTSVGRSIRKLFYGVEEIRSPVPSYRQLAPNIAHVMWFGGGEMNFLFYLSVLSLAHVAEVDKVFIYGGAPKGYYWSLLRKDKKVQLIPHALIKMIYGIPIESLVHMSDILRVEILKIYGGIYLDVDAIAVKPFDREIRAYDAVVNIDGVPSNFFPFPDVINNGVMIGKKDAKFWYIFQESMKQFRDDDYTYNGCRRSYQILERHPDLIRVDPHLQVVCWRFKCHPTWWPGWRNISLDHLSSNITFDWKNDAYVIHWTDPVPHEFKNPKILLNSTGMFAEIGKYVLHKSNMTRYFEIHSDPEW